MLTREQLIKETRARGGNLSTLLGIYVGLLVVLGLTASAII